MITRLVVINSSFPEDEKITEIAYILKSGGIAALPTETVFGLACNKCDKNAVNRLYEIKNRPADKNLVIQIADIAQLGYYQAHITPAIEEMLKNFWPGPLTVILKTRYGNTGFRMPDNNTTLSIIKKLDFPLAVTSANMSGEKDLSCAEDVKSFFDGKIQVVVEDNTKASGISSTVVDCTQLPFKILRPGSVAGKLYKFCEIE
jgi:L-threonylcarbamoyladenylate synthase